MSKVKHKSYRKVLHIEKSIWTQGDIKSVPITTVLWCLVDSLTSRTVKTRHIGITTYVGSFKNNGISAWCPHKPVSLKLKDVWSSKFFETVGEYSIKRSKSKSFSDAARRYILNNSKLSQNLTGEVKWFSGDTGSIYCPTLDMSFRIHACNIQGAKTWFPETACMFVKEKETVIFDLADMGDHLTANKVRGNVYFDSEKWNSLDQSKLAFKCDENGNAINGLFSSGGAS